jgi:aminoglycoside phosphotransferase (APT) family kinase protein
VRPRLPDAAATHARDDGLMGRSGHTAPFGIDEPAVDAWLAEHVEVLTPPCTFELISGGQSNLTFEGRDARGVRFVLRRPPVGTVLQSAHDMGREHRIMSALDRTPVPVPETLGRCDDTSVTGAPFYVMRFVDGVIVRDAVDAEAVLPPSLRPHVGQAMIDALVSLHAVDPTAVGLGDLGRHGDYIARQLRRWSAQWDASTSAEEPIVAVPEAHRRLAASIPAQGRTAIVHGDFRMDNVVLSGVGDVAAVLDWELCTLGEPLADLGMLLVNWVSPGERTDYLLSGTPTAAGGFDDRSVMIARYAQGTGRDVSEIGYFVAFSLWKLACIAEGIRARLNAGAMGDVSAPSQEEMRSKIRGLAEAALATLDSA